MALSGLVRRGFEWLFGDRWDGTARPPAVLGDVARELVRRSRTREDLEARVHRALEGAWSRGFRAGYEHDERQWLESLRDPADVVRDEEEFAEIEPWL